MRGWHNFQRKGFDKTENSTRKIREISSQCSINHLQAHNCTRTTGPMLPAAVGCTDRRSLHSLLQRRPLLPWRHRQSPSSEAPVFGACRLSTRAEPAAFDSRAAATIHWRWWNWLQPHPFSVQRQCRRQSQVGVAFDAESMTRGCRAGISAICHRKRAPMIALRTVRRADNGAAMTI